MQPLRKMSELINPSRWSQLLLRLPSTSTAANLMVLTLFELGPISRPLVNLAPGTWRRLGGRISFALDVAGTYQFSIVLEAFQLTV